MSKWAFDILGIDATKDKREIKRAYAALVKKYDPERQLYSCMRAKEAYEAALKYADSDEKQEKPIQDTKQKHPIYDENQEKPIRESKPETPVYDVKQPEIQPKAQTGSKKTVFWILLIVGIIILVYFGILVFFMVPLQSKKKAAVEQAVTRLNEKYDGKSYEKKDFEAESVYLFDDEDDEIIAYRIFEKDSYDTLVYAVADKEESSPEFTCYDNLQEKEIKKAFQEKLNSLTGYEEGRLFWDSSSGSFSERFEDGYFYTEFDGDFDAFMEKESEVRDSAPGERILRLYGSSAAENGNCDYYIPDQTIESLEQRLLMEEMVSDENLQTVLGQCADTYGVQIRGIMLPQTYFQAKMSQSGWNEISLPVSDNIYSAYIWVDTPLLLMTGWYVNVPEADEKSLEIQNGMYGQIASVNGEGIYSAEMDIDGSSDKILTSAMPGNFVKTETPMALELTPEEEKKSISLQLSGTNILERDYCLAIDKSVYGIADSGYRVLISENWNGEEEVREISIYPYHDIWASVNYSSAIDGDGYLFLDYPMFYEGTEAPIITIVNP